MNTLDDRWFLFGADEPRRDARVRLFCFHYAGSGGSIFQHWSDSLPFDVELVAVQLPGRENRLDEPLLHSMEQVAPPIVDALAPLLDRPFAFFGHSTGALIAFEVARILRQRSLPQPQLLIASAQHAPKVKPQRIRHQLSEPEFIEVLRDGSGIPDAILQSPALLELLLPRIRADGSLFETYRYESQSPLDCRIAVFHGAEDSMVDSEEMQPWEDETQHSFCSYEFPGNHFFIHEEEASVLKHLNRELAPLLREASSTLTG